MWFGTNGGGVARLNKNYSADNKKVFTTYSTAQGLANNVVLSILQDKDGDIWFGTRGGGVSRYDKLRSNSACNTNYCKHKTENPRDINEHNKEISFWCSLRSFEFVKSCLQLPILQAFFFLFTSYRVKPPSKVPNQILPLLSSDMHLIKLLTIPCVVE